MRQVGVIVVVCDRARRRVWLQCPTAGYGVGSYLPLVGLVDEGQRLEDAALAAARQVWGERIPAVSPRVVGFFRDLMPAGEYTNFVLVWRCLEQLTLPAAEVYAAPWPNPGPRWRDPVLAYALQRRRSCEVAARCR